MPDYTASTLDELKQAYALMQLDLSATALTIKQRYRRMASLWHPDKHPLNAPQQLAATEKMKAINAAYELICHAPLRYHIVSHPKVNERADTRNQKHPERQWTPSESAPFNDNLEYWFRFIIGAFLGFMFALKLSADGVPGAGFYFIALPLFAGWACATFANDIWLYLIDIIWALFRW
jgi:curved DNA-binding protein CbpA